MKILFMVQYYPYQYNQFKQLIDKLGADAYYKSDLRNFTNDKRNIAKMEFYDVITHEKNTLDDLSKKNYDFVIYTGPSRTYLKKIHNITKYKFTICLSHSLMGTQYDCKMGMPWISRTIGIMPYIWTKYDSFKHVQELIKNDYGCEYEQITSKSNPIVAEALSQQPRVEIEKGTIGLVLGELSPFEQGRDMCLRNLERLGCNKIKVKFHPLTRAEDKALFENNPKIKILNTDMNKYDFTDSCEYLVGAASSLILEASMRAKYFNRDQKFARLKIKRGVDINLPTLDEFDIIKHSLDKFTMYDDMIMSPEKVIDEHINLIKNAVNYMMTDYKEESTLSGFRTKCLTQHNPSVDYTNGEVKIPIQLEFNFEVKQAV